MTKKPASGQSPQIGPIRVADERPPVRESHRLLERTFASLRDAVFIIDAESAAIKDCNAAACETFGYDRAEMLGRTTGFLHVDPGSLEEFRRLLQAAVAEKGFLFLPDYPMKRRDGTVFPAEHSVGPLEDEPGRQSGWVSVVRDITKRKRAENALRDSEQRFRALIENAADIITVADATGRILYASPSSQRTLDRPVEELTGENIFTLVHPDDVESARRLFQEIVRQPGAMQRTEVRGRRADGSWRVLEVVGRNLLDDPAVRGVVLNSRDITDRRQAENEARRVNRALRAISECGQILVRAAHEPELLREICRIVVETGGYRLAWVGFAEPDAAKTVRPVAQAGYEAGYLETLRITWADTERGRGPTGTAIRTGRPAIVRQILTDPNFSPWRADAIKRGYASEAVFPLLAEGKPFGALNIYASEPDAFDVEEMNLLGELAVDLAYGIVTLRTRAERQRMEAALREAHDQLETRVQLRTAELQAANKALQASEQRVRAVVSNAPVVLFTLDRRGRFTFFDGKSLESFELKPGQVVGQSAPKLLARVPGGSRAARRALRGEAVTWSAKIGELAYQVRLNPLRDARGRVEGVTGVAVDVTEHQQMEEALRQSEREWERTFNSVPDLIAILDNQHRIVRVNRAMARRLGKTPRQCVGLNCFDSVHGLTEPPPFCPHLLTLQDGQEHVVEMHEPQMEGDFLISTTPLLNERGEMAGAVHVARDITERKRAEEEIRDLYNQAPCGYHSLDKDGVIVRINDTELHWLGYTRDEVISRLMLADLLTPDSQKRFQEDFPRFKRRGWLRDAQIEMVRKDGTILPALLNATAIRDDAGRFVMSRTTVFDMTDRQRLEQQILEIAEREQRRIAQELHDGLGQRLTGAAFLGKVLRNRLAARHRPEATNAQQIVDLLNNAVFETRSLSHGLHPVRPVPTSLMDALADLARTTVNIFRLPCRFVCPGQVLVADEAVATHLYRIAQEAVNNAVKHSRAKQLSISLRNHRHGIVLRVRDNGRGIPKIPPAHGGMGLQIMSYRASMIGGSVRVERGGQRGTVVTCTLRVTGTGRPTAAGKRRRKPAANRVGR